MTELEKRVEAIEAWIQAFEDEGEQFLEAVEGLANQQELEVVFIPDGDLLRNKNKDN